MKRHLYTLLFLLCSFCHSVRAEYGTVSGKVLDAKSNEPLIGVNVVIDGTVIGASTDLDGNFQIRNLQAGNYTLNCSYVSYKTKKIEKVPVQAGKTTDVNILLEENIAELNAVNVVANKVTNTEGALTNEIKNSGQVVSGVSSEQIAKTQDRTASDVAKRIPGVTIQDNRFIMIRGLSERYNTVLLNDALTPSMESDKKAFSFDVVPSGLLDRLLIYKTASPELPAEFAGGVIKVYTKNVLDEKITSVNYLSSYRTGTTFGSFYRDEPSKTDFLGYDNGMRKLPSNFPKNLYDVKNIEEQTGYNKTLPNHWVAAKGFALPDQRLSVLIARQIKLKKIQMGNVTSLNYAYTNESYTAKSYNYNAYNQEEQKSDTIYKFTDHHYTTGARIGVLSNWFAILSPKHKIEFRNFFNQIGNSRTTARTGLDFESGYDVKNFAYYYQQRTIYSGQLGGRHDFNNEKTSLEWTAGLSKTRSEEPDYRRIRTVRDISLQNTDALYQVIIPPAASTLDAGRYYSGLSETARAGSADVEQKINWKTEMVQHKIKTGVYFEQKDREFSARWMSYKKARSSQFNDSLLYLPLDKIFAEENINSTTGFKLEEGTNPSDKYSAANRQAAVYLSTSLEIQKKISLSGGVRIEYNRQQLVGKTYASGDIVVDNPVMSLLPSVNAAYHFSEKSLLRAAYGKTINRPEFRELAPFAFYDFNFNNVLYGNDSLKTANIHNYDCRWEWYPSNGEMITAGIFYKQFVHPIEMYFVPGSGSGGTRNFTFDNAESASSIGAEVEIKKSLQSVFKKGILKDFNIVMNAAIIKSEVDLGSRAVGQETQRPMLGQSPYIINAGFYYQNEKQKLQCNLLYNIIGKRIFAVGTFGTPDIYEMPRNSLDATITKSIGKKLEMKLSCQDILNQPSRLMQDSNQDGKITAQDETVLNYRKGSYFSLGFSVKF